MIGGDFGRAAAFSSSTLSAVVETPAWLDQVILAQLGLNESTWPKLQDQGVTEQTPLRLDFLYDTPGRTEAEQLLMFLRAETDYRARLDRGPRNIFRGRPWVVRGQTSEMTVSLDILNAWVRRMVGSGAAHGWCQFVGWGVELKPPS